MGTATRAVILLSGGLDSTVLLYHLLAEGAEVRALSVDYGQRHRRELEAAHAIAGRVGVEHRVADISAVTGLLGGSALTSADIAVPLGHYEDETMKATVVPNRNMILLALATAWAISTQSDTVAYAAHSGDHAIYPDCRAEFAEAMARAVSLCDWHEVRLERPFVGMTKAEIVRRGAELGVPFEVTWSCYQGQTEHCGQCGTCVERLLAFAEAGIEDPVPYQDREYALTVSQLAISG